MAASASGIALPMDKGKRMYCASPHLSKDGVIAAECEDESIRRWDLTGRELGRIKTTQYLRIASLSTVAVGVAAIHSALLYTDRRFAPSAFHQATLNVFTIAGALSLWKALGIYSFAIGNVVGIVDAVAVAVRGTNRLC